MVVLDITATAFCVATWIIVTVSLIIDKMQPGK